MTPATSRKKHGDGKGPASRFLLPTPYLYLAPAGLFILAVFVLPLIRVFRDSFFRIRGASDTFVGLANYRYLLLEDHVFRQSLTNNLLLLAGIPVLLAVSIAIAALLHERLRGWQIHRAIIFLPYALAITVVGVVFKELLTYDGLLNGALRAIGLGRLTVDWLGDPKVALWSLMGVIMWKELGFGVVIFLARLFSLDESLFDAAKVDGASRFDTIVHVAVPQMGSVIEFYVISYVIVMFCWVFNYVYVMTGGGPGWSTYVMELHIYNTAIRNHLMGMACALSVVLFAAVLGFLFVQFKVRPRGDSQGL